MKLRYLGVLLLGAGLVALISPRKERPTSRERQKIIKFSHQYHAEQVGATCTDCHKGVEKSTKASDNLLPKMAEGCGDCHDIQDPEQCTKCHYEDKATYQPFENPKRDIHFNHEVHVERLKMACETCHKGLEKTAYASKANLPTMEDCATCHNNAQATLECAQCHVETVNLRPASHTADFLKVHARFALDEKNCAVCHKPDDCQECHSGSNQLAEPGIPRRAFSPSPGVNPTLVLQRVHDLNFRFTHPLQAEGQRSECARCHEQSTFCADCHRPAANILPIKPDWHGGPDWVPSFARGSGGGRHAELARKDMESCVGCHNTGGTDPTCLLCHIDRDGVRGTDPKTHELGFQNRFSEDSDFHKDDRAICFTCHVVSVRQAGVGFCGYCHGPKD